MSISFLLGLLLVTIAGAMEGLFSLGLTRTPKWKWENSWGLGSLVALIAVPWPLALATVPHLGQVYGAISSGKLCLIFLLGIGWGIGGIFWGKAIAAVGMALGVSLLMGLINIFGSLGPFALFQLEKLHTAGGWALMASIGIMTAGVASIARAGKLREQDLGAAKTEEGVRSGSRFAVGLLFCVLSGMLSALVNFSLIYGADIAASAEKAGAPPWAKSFAIWALVFTGNYLVNFLYAAFLMARHQSFGQIAQGDARHWFWIVFMGIAWPAGIAVYGIAAFLLGDFGAYVGFPMMLVCSILCGNLAGALAGEWKGTSGRSRGWMAWGVSILLVSLGVMGWATRLLGQ